MKTDHLRPGVLFDVDGTLCDTNYLHALVRYEHASEERDALLAQALNQFAESSNVVPITSASPGDRARDEGEVEGEVLELPPLTRENDENCSGGETRTLNSANAERRSFVTSRIAL